MARVKARDTGPELVVRRILTELGYRYRLHRPDIPGRPDIAFIGRRKLVFVHGCFWHGHACPRGSRVPKANRDYWTAKIARNRTRDARTAAVLAAAGWDALAIWECELRDRATLSARLLAWLGPAARHPPPARAPPPSP